MLLRLPLILSALNESVIGSFVDPTNQSITTFTVGFLFGTGGCVIVTTYILLIMLSKYASIIKFGIIEDGSLNDGDVINIKLRIIPIVVLGAICASVVLLTNLRRVITSMFDVFDWVSVVGLVYLLPIRIAAKLLRSFRKYERISDETESLFLSIVTGVSVSRLIIWFIPGITLYQEIMLVLVFIFRIDDFFMRVSSIPRRIQSVPYICQLGCGREFDTYQGLVGHESWSRRRGYCVPKENE